MSDFKSYSPLGFEGTTLNRPYPLQLTETPVGDGTEYFGASFANAADSNWGWEQLHEKLTLNITGIALIDSVSMEDNQMPVLVEFEAAGYGDTEYTPEAGPNYTRTSGPDAVDILADEVTANRFYLGKTTAGASEYFFYAKVYRTTGVEMFHYHTGDGLIYCKPGAFVRVCVYVEDPSIETPGRTPVPGISASEFDDPVWPVDSDPDEDFALERLASIVTVEDATSYGNLTFSGASFEIPLYLAPSGDAPYVTHTLTEYDLFIERWGRRADM